MAAFSDAAIGQADNSVPDVIAGAPNLVVNARHDYSIGASDGGKQSFDLLPRSVAVVSMD